MKQLDLQAVEVLQNAKGNWGVKAVWQQGSPAVFILPHLARDYAFAALSNGDKAWADRVMRAAALADKRERGEHDDGVAKEQTERGQGDEQSNGGMAGVSMGSQTPLAVPAKETNTSSDD